MEKHIDPHNWLDAIITEQRRIQGKATELLREAAEATEYFTEDELEQEADRRRRLEAASEEEPQDE